MTQAQFEKAVADTIVGTEVALKEARARLDALGICAPPYRVRAVELSGEITLEDGTVTTSTVTRVPLEPSTSLTTEAQSIQTQESEDNLTQQTQNSGEKIFEETIEVTDNT